MRGPVGSRGVAAQVSQHVPVSPRARTAADITIVYSRRPWVSGRHCAFPLWLVANTFLGEGLQCESSAWYARAGRCLVSPIRLRRFCDAVCADAAGCDAHCPTRLHASTPDDRASSSEDFGARRANASGYATWLHATTIWFRSERRL